MLIIVRSEIEYARNQSESSMMGLPGDSPLQPNLNSRCSLKMLNVPFRNRDYADKRNSRRVPVIHKGNLHQCEGSTEDCRLLGTKIATKSAHAQNFNSKFPPNFAHAAILCQATCNPLYL